jgi:hypothetical protein
MPGIGLSSQIIFKNWTNKRGEGEDFRRPEERERKLLPRSWILKEWNFSGYNHIY